MRVIAGTAKGIRLDAPDGVQTRPTADRVKEGFFSAIQFYLENAKVLDLFAGSGQLGIEALSRGAAECVFCDISYDACQTVNQNLLHAGFSGKAQVFNIAYDKMLRSLSGGFNLIFIDPPYKKGLAFQSMELISAMGVAAKKGIIIAETDKDEFMPEKIRQIKLYKKYVYGSTAVRIYANLE